LDALTIVLTVVALLLYGFIYWRTRTGGVSWLGPIGVAFIIGGVWNLVVGKEGGWSQVGIGVVGVLIVVVVVALTYRRRGSEEGYGRRGSKEGTAKKANSIFVNYRRSDTAGYAGRLADDLDEHFRENMVFHDIDSIAPGTDFVEATQRAIGSAEVLLAVIGRSWLNATNFKRLQDPKDYVRLEILTALNRDTRVIPVLVEGASMPSADQLPEDLSPLTRRNAFELHENSWGNDVQRLIIMLEQLVEDSRPKEQPPRGKQPKGGSNFDYHA
jgi:hypothetical protein